MGSKKAVLFLGLACKNAIQNESAKTIIIGKCRRDLRGGKGAI
jgi:hypothetical protein